MEQDTHYLIVGAGIVGVSIANCLSKLTKEKIVVIDKEEGLGCHASGRNSGVLHAGFYYTPTTLKAKLTKEGNKALRKYCKEKGLKINETGKVLVCRNERDLKLLGELKSRGDKNQVEVHIIDQHQLKDIEPFAKTYKKALYSPTTAIFDPKEILYSMAEDVRKNGVTIMLSTKLLDINGNSAFTSKGKINFKLLINCAGLYADYVAHKMDVGADYKILPFKGIYFSIKEKKSHIVKSNIYPVPDLGLPFLGVHLSRFIDNKVYVGPTANPALGRENYGFFDIDLEALEILKYNLIFLIKDEYNYRKYAIKEVKKYTKSGIYTEITDLVKGISYEDITDSSKVGIRAQLIDARKKKLIMDFLVEKGKNSVHILNAVSPAFTCSIPFAEYVTKKFII